MARYFFDIHDGVQIRDEMGVELPDLEAVRKEAMQGLPSIASNEIPKDGDRQCYAMLVTSEDGRPVYSATLSYVGQWLHRT